MNSRVLGTLFAGAIAVALFAPLARADERDAAMAEALFRAAKDLQAQGKNNEACPKYADSFKLDPKPGTMLNLATCHENAGDIASAWASYQEAAVLAGRAKQADREKFAKKKVAELEKRLAYVTYDVAQSSAIEVTVDGKPLPPAAVGTRVPIDPGEHALEAHALAKKTWKTTFLVDAGPSEKTVKVPELEDDEVAVPPPSTTPASEPPRESGSRGGTQRTLGWITAGVGVAGLAVGGFFGARTLSEKSTVDSNCTGNFCNADGLSANDSAKSAATISTIGFLAGAVLVAGGIALVLTAPHGSTQARARRPELAW
ncbi:MAG TPA: hypothetical protein VIF62_06535 [Labilithrix sp.]